MNYEDVRFDLELSAIQKFISANNWVFAKTMPKHPHFYIVKQKCSDKEFFYNFAGHIRKYGYKSNFFRVPRIYYELDGWKYWTQGAPLEDTIIINRAELEKKATI